MKNYLKIYLRERPLFISIIRSKEAELFEGALPLKKPILDFGCGDGFFTKLVFGEIGGIDVGLDIDQKSLKEAKVQKIYKKVVKYDGEALPFGDGVFSTVISNCVLEHIPNLRNSLSEIHRVLKTKGKFICSVMTSNWENYMFGPKLLGKLYLKWMRHKQNHYNLLTLRKWNGQFKDAGFKIVKVKGYLREQDSLLMDILHYFSVDSLWTKKLLDKWVVFPQRYDIIPVERWLKKRSDEKVSPSKSSALFFVLEKI